MFINADDMVIVSRVVYFEKESINCNFGQMCDECVLPSVAANDPLA